MSIINLNLKQISITIGARYQQNTGEVAQYILRDFVGNNPTFREIDHIEQCVNVVKTTYGFTLCKPAKKPLTCSYEQWGILHDLEEELPRC